MKSPKLNSVEEDSTSKPKAKGTSRASKPRKSAAKSKPAPKADTKADWRGEALAHMRALILEADPEMTEEVKWRKPSNGMAGVPVWSHNGIVCTGETYTKVVKLTFAKGASLPDPSRLFNASLDGNTRRAIDIHEGEKINAGAFKTLIKAAVVHNAEAQHGPRARRGSPDPAALLDRRSPREDSPSRRGQRRPSVANSGGVGRPAPSAAKLQKNENGVVLLSGGNPQIAKADGDAPVQTYIDAMPGWKHDVGCWLDALIVRTVPDVRKAVRWNTPFYGIEGQGWFLGFHCITKYVKVAFFRGTSLRPLPPGESRQKDVRYLDIHEDDQLDEKLVASWIRQASELPGEALF